MTEAEEYESAARNATTHANVHMNAARHHRAAAARNPHMSGAHEAKARMCEERAARHAAAAERHLARAAEARAAGR